MAKVAKDKWDKVIEHLTHSDSDLEKVLSLLKGCDQGNASNYDVNRVSYSLNIIAIVKLRSCQKVFLFAIVFKSFDSNEIKLFAM